MNDSSELFYGTAVFRLVIEHPATIAPSAVVLHANHFHPESHERNLPRSNKRALSASLDHTLKLWNLESGAELRTLSGHAHTVKAVAVFAGGQRALSARRKPCHSR